MSDPLSTRDEICAAAYACIARYGMAKTTVEDVARASGISRATVYRHFPGGRDELIQATVAWELARYFQRLADEVRAALDIESLLRSGLAFARRSIDEHEVLQKMLVTEPDRLLPLLTVEADRALPFIAAFLQPYLERERAADRLRSGLDVEGAAQYLARGILSLIGHGGLHDLEDPDQLGSVVRHELLGGILEPTT